MAVISASCTLEAHLAIGSQTYVATDYVAVGYIDHTLSSDAFTLATANVSSTLSVSVAAKVFENVTANISSTSNVSATARFDASANVTAPSTVNVTVAAGQTIGAAATFGGQTGLTVDTLVFLPFGIHGRPARFGNQIIRRNTTEPFFDAFGNVMRVGNSIEFIGTTGTEKNYMFVPGSELQVPINANDPWTLEFRFKPANAQDSSSVSNQVPKRIFEYFNHADDGDTYIYIDCRDRFTFTDSEGQSQLVSRTSFTVGYRYSDDGSSYSADFNETFRNLETYGHFAITYDGNTSGSDGPTVQFYLDGRTVVPAAGLFTTDSAGESRPTGTWTPPSHSTSEWRFGDLDTDTSENHFFMDDIRLTKGLLYPRDPAQRGIATSIFTPPGGGNRRFIDQPPGTGQAYQWTYDDSTAITANDGSLEITSDTAFLINGTNNLLVAEIDITPTVSVAVTAKEFEGAIIDITSTSSASITAVEVPESTGTTIASTSNLTVAPRVDFVGTVNITPSVNVSVTAQEVIEQASVTIPITATVTPTAVKTVVSTASIPITSSVSVTAVEVPESVSVNISSPSDLTVNAGIVGEGLAPINATSSLTVTGTVGLTVVTQNINMPSTLSLNISGDRIRLGTTTITSTSNVATTAVETPETTSTTIASTLNVTVAGVRQPLATVNITSTPGLTANVIPNVFRILAANTLKIPKQTRTFAVPEQNKTTVIPKQTRLNTVNKQTRILPIPKQTRVLEIET